MFKIKNVCPVRAPSRVARGMDLLEPWKVACICAAVAALALLCWCCLHRSNRVFDSALLAVSRV